MTIRSLPLARVRNAILIATVLVAGFTATDGVVAAADAFAGNATAMSHASSRSRQRAPIVFADPDVDRFHASSRGRQQSTAAIAPAEAMGLHAVSRTRLGAGDALAEAWRFHAVSRMRGGSATLTVATSD